MKKPWKKVKIFGIDVPMFKIPGLSQSGFYGLFETHGEKEECRILLDSDMEKCMFERVMLHEMFHAVFNRTNVTAALDPGLEEIVVDQCARMIMDNFKIVWK